MFKVKLPVYVQTKGYSIDLRMSCDQIRARDWWPVEIFNLRNQKEKQLFIHWVMEEDHVMVGNFPAVTLGSPRVNSFKLPGMRVALSEMARIPYLYTQRRC